MYSTFKFRIYPTEDQRIFFVKTFGCCRFIWNKMLEDRQKQYMAWKLDNTLKQKLPTPAHYKIEFPWLKEVDAVALCHVQLNLQKAFSAFLRSIKQGGSTGYPNWKSKRSRQSYKTDVLKLVEGRIKLPHVGWVKCCTSRFPDPSWTFRSVTITQTPTGKYFVSILFDTNIGAPEKIEPKLCVGLDYSSPELFVDSSGLSPSYPKFYRQVQKKLVKAQRKLSKRKHGGSNWEKQRKKVALLHEKVANQRKDFLHKLSTVIAKQYDMVAIEDLDLISLSQNLKLGKATLDNGFGMFREMLIYKLTQQGKHLVKIGKWYPSTKTCSRCSGLREVPLSERVYNCDHCGLSLNRDHNAALNIRNEGIRIMNGSNYRNSLFNTSIAIGASQEVDLINS